MSDAPIEHSIAGTPARELAQTYGTPLFVIDLDVLDLDIDRFARAFGPHNIAIGYAAKAFVCTALAEHLAATSLRLDVCSLGELVTAERGGFPPGRIYFHGCGKTDAELRAIVDRRVAFDVIDNTEELERLAAFAAGGEPVDVMLRVNTGIEAHTHEFVRTGGENTKFGFALTALPAVFARIAELPALRLIGLHSHIGSQIEDAAPFLANLDELLAVAATARDRGLPVAELLCGGGIAVTDGDDAQPLDLDALAAELAQRAAGSGFALSLEPGRALIARAGTSLYAVMGVKTQGSRRFVIVDGGMADNPRPIMYGAHHPAETMAMAAAPGAAETVTLAGRSCENDELGTYELPGNLAAGDLLALRTTGAYTYSMASNYNRFGRPPVIFARDGHHRRVVRGETPEDVAQRDLA